jgi:integrase/recombinase XerD
LFLPIEGGSVMTTKAIPVTVRGPLASYAQGFIGELARLGYTPLSAARQSRRMAQLSRWLAGEGLGAADLTDEHMKQFLEVKRAKGDTNGVSVRGFEQLVDYLRARGAAPQPVPAAVSPVTGLLADFRTYLLQERGLVEATVCNNERAARLFLDRRCLEHRGDPALEELSAQDVASFALAECQVRGIGSAKMLVTGLRSLLRFLYVSGRVPLALWSAVPAVAGWRGGSLPQGLPPGQVSALLGGCDRRRRVGRRDFAILMLLGRLGLRAGEVAALELDDIDWRAGDLIIRGKGRRQERLPLPADVGEAIAAYLSRGRPPSSDRYLFRRARAPQGRLVVGAVKAVVRNGCLRAGIAPFGPHRLRHTVATQMLAAGAGLPEVAQLLRHASIITTAGYAKVDRGALRALALPWPGGGS